MAKLIFAIVFATVVVSSLAVPVDNNGAGEGQPEKKSRLIKLQSPHGARSLGDGYYVSDYYDKVSFVEAEKACKEAELRLVTLKTASKRSDIETLLRSNGVTDEVWIGLTDRGVELQWKWIDNTVLRISNWSPNSGNYPDYDCASLCPENNFYWFHRNCGTHYRFLCEEKP